MREVSKQSDLKGIRDGEQWVFTGWPELTADQDMDKYFKEEDKAREQFKKLVAYADKEAAKSAEKDKTNNGRGNGASK